MGCGGRSLPEWICDFEEIRLDIDASHAPHIVASMTDMGDIGEFDAVHCSHALEHLYPEDVPKALAEFLRVLKSGGNAIIVVPDLEDVRISDDVLFVSPSGPIRALDLIYGFSPMLKSNPHMAHHTGFVRATLAKAMKAAGFGKIAVARLSDFNLMGVGIKP